MCVEYACNKGSPTGCVAIHVYIYTYIFGLSRRSLFCCNPLSQKKGRPTQGFLSMCCLAGGAREKILLMRGMFPLDKLFHGNLGPPRPKWLRFSLWLSFKTKKRWSLDIPKSKVDPIYWWRLLKPSPTLEVPKRERSLTRTT